VEPPYSAGQLSEESINLEISRIYDSAKPETKSVYDLGHDTDRFGKEKNWVIWWMLWHVYRYRDNRNKTQSRGLSPHDDAVAVTSPNSGKSLRPIFHV
jgi:hypothetical protein